MRPFSGLLCDRFPKKRLLILSAVGYTVLPLLFLAELPYGVLLGARIAQGFCMGIASTGRCRDRHLLHPEVPLYRGREHFWRRHGPPARRSRPGIGLWILAHFGYTGVFLYSSFTGLLIIALVLPIRCRETIEKPQSKACLGELLRGLYEPTALYSAACTLFLAVMQITVMQFLSYYTASRGVNGTYAFYTLSAVAVVTVRLTIGRISGAKADRVILLTGTLILAAAYGGLRLLFPTALSLGILSVLYGCGHSMSGIVLNSMALSEAPPERMGAANATYLAASDLRLRGRAAALEFVLCAIRLLADLSSRIHWRFGSVSDSSVCPKNTKKESEGVNSMAKVIIAILYIAAILVIGFLAGRNVKTADEFAVANRNIPYWTNVFSMSSAWIGAGSTLGCASMCYAYGVSGFYLAIA